MATIVQQRLRTPILRIGRRRLKNLPLAILMLIYGILMGSGGMAIASKTVLSSLFGYPQYPIAAAVKLDKQFSCKKPPKVLHAVGVHGVTIIPELSIAQGEYDSIFLPGGVRICPTKKTVSLYGINGLEIKDRSGTPYILVEQIDWARLHGGHKP